MMEDHRRFGLLRLADRGAFLENGVFGNLPLEAFKDRWAFAGREDVKKFKSCEDATEQIPFYLAELRDVQLRAKHTPQWMTTTCIVARTGAQNKRGCSAPSPKLSRPRNFLPKLSLTTKFSK
jgi:hypothetical protein